MKSFWDKWVDYTAITVLVFLFAMLAFGCDENETPAVHGVIRVDASPIPPFEIEFKGSPSPTPVEP